MARYPHAHWRPLPEADREPLIAATQVILHTAVSGAGSLFGYFARADVHVESHFYVNERATEQYIDTGRQADANRNANVRAISIETWDAGDPESTPWTPRQMDVLVDLVAWCCRTHGIPARQCATPTSPGIGWHAMWGAPSEWTPAVGKTCPGGPRIAQVPELIRRVQAALTGSPTPHEEDDMSAPEVAAIRQDIATLKAVVDNNGRWEQLATAGALKALDAALTTPGHPVRTGVREVIAVTLREDASARAALKSLVREVLAEPDGIPDAGS